MTNTDKPRIVDKAWTLPATEVARQLEVAPDAGLSAEEARQRRARYGLNILRQIEQRSALRILVDQFRSTIVFLLIAAAALSFWFGGATEGVAILAVILINALIGFVVELRAVRSMDALRALGCVKTCVRREGMALMIPAQDVVPGDILVLEGGDTVTADARLLKASRLRVDESSFTGESVPVDKLEAVIETAERVDQRANMLFKGTSLTTGSCEAVVVATGMQTELGLISALTETSGTEITPLEEQLARVGNKLIALTVLIVIFVVGVGIAAGKSIALMVETGVALAVATIPEGLPIVATIALARGLWRMSRRNALINRLSAVETLGATSIICTDKTGTLTENRMRLAEVWLSNRHVELGDSVSGDDLLAAVKIGVLCNRASLGSGENESVGDPLEVALLCAGRNAGMDRKQLVEHCPEVATVAFDSDSKLMATYHDVEGSFMVAVKGAPEAVLAHCDAEINDNGREQLDDARRQEWLGRSEKLAERGLRVIAVAEKVAAGVDEPAYDKLAIRALYGLLDPPRLEVKDAIAACQGAGMRILMITGDHPATAGAIARAVGLVREADRGSVRVVPGSEAEDLDSLSPEQTEALLRESIFARVSPAQKLNIIHLHQRAGRKVGMIGDGVNDAPALEQADIGIAMGKRGTQVAREAADMVLADDSFSSIVAAVEQGRVIFGNIRRFVIYLLSCNISEVLVLGIAAGMKAPLPILPMQILFLNLVSDIFPALALGVGRGDGQVMARPPRDSAEGILATSHIRWIMVYGLIMTASVLGAFFVCLGPLDGGAARATTVAFLTLAFAQLWHVFNMSERSAPLLVNDVTRNAWVWGALLLCVVLLLGALFIPLTAAVLELTTPTPTEWTVIAGFSFVPVVFGIISRLLQKVGPGEGSQ